MRTIQLIESLQISPAGPSAQEAPVHLRQGDADGACGPYCVLMALLALGLATRDAAMLTNGIDNRTRMGRVWATFSRWGPLVCNGTDEENIAEVLAAYGPNAVLHRPERTGRKGVNDFILEHLNVNHPVVVGIEAQGGGKHWVLAVGVDVGLGEDDAKRLLILDPGLEVSSVCAWNSVIELATERIKYPSACWNPHEVNRCVIETALAISIRSPSIDVG